MSDLPQETVNIPLVQQTAEEYNANLPPPAPRPFEAWRNGVNAPTVQQLYEQGYRGATYSDAREYTPQPLNAEAGAGFNYDKLLEARSAGYSWDEIGSFQAMQRSRAYDAGYTQEEIRDYLSLTDWQAGDRRYEGSWGAAFSSVPALITGLSTPRPEIDLTQSPGYRQDYVQALLRGEVDGPRDFAYRYAAAALKEFDDLPGQRAIDPEVVKARQFAAGIAAEALSTQLPSVEDLTDATIGALASAPVEPIPADRARAQLLDTWARGGPGVIQQVIDGSVDPTKAALYSLDRANLYSALNNPVAQFFTDFLPGVGEGFWWSREDIQNALKDATFAEQLGATLGRVVSPRAFWDMFAGNGEIVTKVAQGGPVSAEEAARIALSMAHFSRFPGGVGPARPEVLPPLPRVELPPPTRPPGAPPTIEGEYNVVGHPVKLPPLPDVPLIDFARPNEVPRMLTAREAVIDPIPPAEQAIAKIGEALSLEDKTGRMDLLRTENEIGPGATGEAPMSFFQRKVAEMQAAGELPEGTWRTQMAEPTPERLMEIAEGYDNARTIGGWATDTFKALVADEAGTLRIFPSQAERAQQTKTRTERRAIEGLIVEEQSRGEREIIHVENAFRPLRKYLNAIDPEFRAELAKGPMGAPMMTQVGALINYIEGVGYGPALRLDDPITPVANVVRGMNQWKYQLLQDAYQRGDIDETSYVDNYFRHLWKDPVAGTNFFHSYMDNQPPPGSGRQGSGATQKARTLPTFADGIRRNLEPAIPNIADLVIYDLSSTIKFIHAAAIRNRMESELGLLNWRTKRIADEEQLTGVGAQRSRPVQANLGLRQAEAAARDQLAQADAPFQRRISKLETDLQSLINRQASSGAISYARQLVADEKNVRNQTLKPLREAVAKATEAAAPGAYMEFAYAPPHVAKVYNNWLSVGWGNTGESGASIAENLMRVKNRLVGLKLALPIFHAMVIAEQVASTGLSEMMNNLATGHPFSAARNAAETALFFPQAMKLYRQGIKARDDYVNMVNDPILNQLVDAGMRIGKRQPMYQTGPANPYWTAIAQNNAGADSMEKLGNIVSAAGRDLKERLDHVGGPMGERLFPHKGPDDKFHFGSAVLAPFRFLQIPIDEMARALSSANVPLFDHLIPVMKAGANMNTLQNWLHTHPNASPEIVKERARQIVEDAEWRFGEQNLNNVFWPNKMKQTAQIATISATWAISTWLWTASALKSAYAIGEELATKGSLKGLPQNHKWNPITLQSFVGTLVVMTMLNGVWSALHTGQLPSDPRDFIAFDTGVSRGILPTEFKEFIDQGKIAAEMYGRTNWNNPMYQNVLRATGTLAAGEAAYVGGKFNDMIRWMQAMTGGEDAIGRKPGYMPGGWARWYQELVMPMVLENWEHPKAGTGLHWAENFFAREAPLWITNPAAFYKQQQVEIMGKWENQGIMRAIRDNAKLVSPKYDVTAPPKKARGGKPGSLFEAPGKRKAPKRRAWE